MEQKGLYNYLLILVLTAFALPLLVTFIPVNDKELHGVTEPLKQPAFSAQGWLSGDFQKSFEPYLNFSLGLRKAAVRTASQLHYWLGEQRNEVVVGLQNELMGKEYIDAYYGRDFLGADSIHGIVNSVATFKNELQKRGIQFFVVIAPNKCRLYPQRIPEQFKGPYTLQTNYNYFTNELNKAHIPVVNFQEWFNAIEPTSPYPLFSNLGVHWSYYAATFATDSLLGYISNLTGKKTNRIQYNEIVATTKPYDTDKDLLEVMNLWTDIPVTKPLGYFKTTLPIDTALNKPAVLAIGDSYYWNCIYTGVPAAYFKQGSAYFYYNATAHFNNGTTAKVSELNLLQTCLTSEVVFFIYAEPNLVKFGNGIDVKFLQLLSATNVPTNTNP
jgi:hypothetical protein